MLETLEQQRAAFFSELPVPLAIRQDRLRRAMALVEENSGALCAALCRDRAQQDQESAMRIEITPALAALRNSLRNAATLMRPVYGHGLWGRLVHWGGDTEYQPVGVVGIAAPAADALRQTVSLLANALAAGNHVIVQFDPATPHFSRLFAQLAHRYFSALELHIADGPAEDAGAFGALPFDLLVKAEPADAEHANGAVLNHGLSGAPIPHSGKSPVIIGRSADLAKATEQVIANQFRKPTHQSLAPDYLLVPAEQMETMASWLWRAAMHLHPRMATEHTERDLPLSDSKLAGFTRLIEDARARGAEILIAEPPDRRGWTGVQRVPLHIVQHATDDMLVMQEEICGPILPLLGYGHIDEAISAIHRHGVPVAIYHFGRDDAERRHILARTISSVIALDGRSLAVDQTRVTLASAEANLNAAHGDTGFRGFSRARRIYR